MSDNKTFFKKAKGGKLGFSDIFSDVFRRHTKEENARLFLAGTPLTTPDAASMLSKWLKPKSLSINSLKKIKPIYRSGWKATTVPLV